MTGSFPGHLREFLHLLRTWNTAETGVWTGSIWAGVRTWVLSVDVVFWAHLSSCVDVCAGKVAVKKEDLQKYHGKDTWFQLQPVSADSEVQVSTERQHTHTHTHTQSHIFTKVTKHSLLISSSLLSTSTETTWHESRYSLSGERQDRPCLETGYRFCWKKKKRATERRGVP